MELREAVEKDHYTILDMHLDAFGEAEGKTISNLVSNLFEDKTALPLLSLVAEINDSIVGHILFTTIHIDGTEIEDAYILAPLAVATEFQGKGVGAKLIKQGLLKLKETGAALVLVYGDPKYYIRHGFKVGHKLKAPYELQYPEAWMAQELKEGVLDSTEGTVKCVSSLSSPEYW